MAESKRLSKSGVISTLAERTELEKRQVKKFLEEFVGLIHEEVKRAGQFSIPDVGKITKRDRKARMGRNPATGESIKIGAKTVLKFRVAKSCKVAILGEDMGKKKSKSKDKKHKSSSKKHKSH